MAGLGVSWQAGGAGAQWRGQGGGAGAAELPGQDGGRPDSQLDVGPDPLSGGRQHGAGGRLAGELQDPAGPVGFVQCQDGAGHCSQQCGLLQP